MLAVNSRRVKISSMDDIANDETIAVKTFDTMLTHHVDRRRVKHYQLYDDGLQGGNATVCYGVVDEGNKNIYNMCSAAYPYYIIL